MESALISEWYVMVGEAVDEGAPLFAMETAKAVYDVAAPVAGVVTSVRAAVGDEVQVHQLVATIGTDARDVVADENVSAEADSGSPSEAVAAASLTPTSEAQVAGDLPGRPASSPRARWTAEQAGIPLEDISGSGPGGRITVRDVQRHRAALRDASSRAAEAAIAPASRPSEPAVRERRGGTTTPLMGVRAVIAERMTQAAAVPAVTLDTQVDARPLRAFVDRLRSLGQTWDMPRITINDIVCATTARVLRRHGAMNAWLRDSKITMFDHVDLGIAVAAPHGLVVPVVRDAHTLSLADFARQSRALADAVRERRADSHVLSGSTFSVSNLGAYGVRTFNPMLNPPEVAILGVGTIAPAVLPDGAVGDAMTLSLTFDHRAVDGATAAEFLRDLTAALIVPDAITHL